MGNNRELFKVRTLTEAIDSLKPYVLSFYQRVESIPLADSLGRILIEDIPATYDIPHFRKATMDGMAVRAADTFGASESMPALVNCYGEVRMGEAPAESLKLRRGFAHPYFPITIYQRGHTFTGSKRICSSNGHPIHSRFAKMRYIIGRRDILNKDTTQ